jgi:hypothetical protein
MKLPEDVTAEQFLED